MLALHNMNQFHFHLSEDQGWRIEIKKYPKLTEVGAYRDGTVIGRNGRLYDSIRHGGFYTQEELRDLVQYAADRHVNIIPEIDLPGHMQAALASYPQLGCTGGPYEVWKRWGVSDDVLCAGNEEAMLFVEDVLNEVMDIFPSPYIHIGGDECPKVRWEKCPKCQAKIKELGIKGDDRFSKEDYLQSYVMNRMAKVVEARGRRVIGWDEILEGNVSETAIIMSWRGTEGGIEAALWELAEEAKAGLRVDLRAIPIRQETVEVFNTLDQDPYILDSFGSWLLFAENGAEVLAQLHGQGETEAAVIGYTTKDRKRILSYSGVERFLLPPKRYL
jgi:hexosaminidase